MGVAIPSTVGLPGVGSVATYNLQGEQRDADREPEQAQQGFPRCAVGGAMSCGQSAQQHECQTSYLLVEECHVAISILTGCQANCLSPVGVARHRVCPMLWRGRIPTPVAH